MISELAVDPGAWNIIAWIVVVAAIGAVVLWAVSTLLLRGRPSEARDEPAPHQP